VADSFAAKKKMNKKQEKKNKKKFERSKVCGNDLLYGEILSEKCSLHAYFVCLDSWSMCMYVCIQAQEGEKGA
jgi:hypothetical protein